MARAGKEELRKEEEGRRNQQEGTVRLEMMRGAERRREELHALEIAQKQITQLKRERGEKQDEAAAKKKARMVWVPPGWYEVATSNPGEYYYYDPSNRTDTAWV